MERLHQASQRLDTDSFIFAFILLKASAIEQKGGQEGLQREYCNISLENLSTAKIPQEQNNDEQQPNTCTRSSKVRKKCLNSHPKM